MIKITVIYDTLSGNTDKMAKAVAEGAKTEYTDVVLKHIDDASAADLLTSDGVIVGSPTHCGLLSWKIKKFFDENTRNAWGKVEGKIGAAFSTSGGLGGGNELTCASILNVLINYGFLVFGLTNYAAPGITGHYGAVSIGSPDQNELNEAKMLGLKMAQLLKRFKMK